MGVEPDGLPRVGKQSKCLGVREPPGDHADVEIDGTGHVLLNRKGLSVTRDWRDLPGHLIPEHLDDGFNGARGKGMNVFAHGTGTFDEGEIAEGLELLHKTGTVTAGVVAPTVSVLLAEYQQALAATRPDWIIDET
jgi:hypothetical protein